MYAEDLKKLHKISKKLDKILRRSNRKEARKLSPDGVSDDVVNAIWNAMLEANIAYELEENGKLSDDMKYQLICINNENFVMAKKYCKDIM